MIKKLTCYRKLVMRNKHLIERNYKGGGNYKRGYKEQFSN